MAETAVSKKRPVHLDLPKIRLPLPGIVSILHRVSGAGLFLLLPFLLSLFQGSVSDGDAFAAFQATVANPLVKLILLGLLWAYLHHFCAGIRFLLLDAHKGLDLPVARMSAKLVLAFSLALTVIIGVKLW